MKNFPMIRPFIFSKHSLVLTLILLSSLSCLQLGYTQSSCWQPEQVQQLVRDYQSKKTHTPTQILKTLDDAYCTQSKFLKRLQHTAPQDKIVGYKAGFTSEGIQKKLNLNQPVYGTFYKSMMLKSGSTISVDAAPELRYELDLIAVIGDEKISQATTPQEILSSISHIQAFIELPSFIMSPKTPHFAYHVVGANVFARLGVLGSTIALKGSAQERYKRLENLKMTIQLNGRELESKTADALLGHPAYVIYKIIAYLKKNKHSIHKGMLLSLGSVSKFYTPRIGDQVEAVYQLGLQNMKAYVSFEPAIAP